MNKAGSQCFPTNCLDLETKLFALLKPADNDRKRRENCHLTGDTLELRDDRIVPVSRAESALRGKDGTATAHVERLRDILAALDLSRGPEGMNLPGFRPHELKGPLKGCWAVSVPVRGRILAVDVDYH